MPHGQWFPWLKRGVVSARLSAADESGDARFNPLDLAYLGWMNECDHEVFKEPIHSQQTGHRQPFAKGGVYGNRATRDVGL